jgi:D-alanine-D-alanine ligase
MTRVAVVTGGTTPEREVAFAGAAQVVAALRDRQHEVSVVDTVSGLLTPGDERRLLAGAVGRTPPTVAELNALRRHELGPKLVELDAVRDADLVFLVLHGREGEGGALQALLDLAGIPYTGSGPLGSAVAMDKDVAKRLFRHTGIPTADWLTWPASPREIATLGLPVVVKPVKVGSTVGLTLVRASADIEEAVRTALDFDDEVMLERFIPGREFTVGVLGGEALAVGEIITGRDIFDYEAKYTPGVIQEIFPADIAPPMAAELRRLALAVHRALKLRDFSRVDFRAAADGALQCLEANTLPGLTRTSLLPQSAGAVGIRFPDLCDTICRLALQRADRGNKVEA